MKIGFTGTREGLTPDQRAALHRYVCELPALTEFHHGCCVGADEQAVEMLGAVWVTTDADARTWRVVGHPGDWGPLTSKSAAAASAEMKPCRRMLDRNRDIVDACDVLLACPKGMSEEQRSGTWATVRYARKVRRTIVIFWPDGSTTQEERFTT